MQNILDYAPWLIVAIVFFHQYKVFMTPADFQKEKADFLEYIAEHYVSVKTCNSQNAHVSDAITLLRGDIKHLSDLIEQRIRQSEAK